MSLMKTLPALLASLAFLPVQAQSDGVGRMDESAKKQLAVDFKSCAKPEYPKESLRYEQTGRVTLEFLIGLDGKVVESKVLQSSGFPLLDLAAQDGLAKCRFTPPSSVGRTEPTRTRMQYVWTLEEKSPAERQAEWQRYLAEAEQGIPESQRRLASRYLRGRAEERNPAEGIRWLRAAVEQGYAPAMVALAYELKLGQNTGRDPIQSLELLEKAAAQGLANAEFLLAMSLIGPGSVRQDDARARALLEKALARGERAARLPLAHILLNEGGGSSAEGLRLMQVAADEQDRMAQFMLAALYEKGEQVPADPAKALALYERAAAAGVPAAKTALARLKQQAGR